MLKHRYPIQIAKLCCFFKSNLQNYIMKFLNLYIALALSCSITVAQDSPSIAIVPSWNQEAGLIDQKKNEYFDIFHSSATQILIRQGVFKLVDRRFVASTLQEQKISLSGAVNDGNVVKVGELLGAKKLLVTDVSLLDNSVYLKLNLLNSETGEVIAALDESCPAEFNKFKLRAKQAALKMFPDSTGHPANYPCKVLLRLIEASGFPPTKTNGSQWDMFSPADIFIELRKNQRVIDKTVVKNDITSNIEKFDVDFEIEIESLDDVLWLYLWDHDDSGNDFMDRVRFDLAKVYESTAIAALAKHQKRKIPVKNGKYELRGEHGSSIWVEFFYE